MPAPTDLVNWTNPDEMPQDIFTVGGPGKVPRKWNAAPHKHKKCQLLLPVSGALSCEVEDGLWIVPPKSALWIPNGAMHSMKAMGQLKGYDTFIAPRVAAGLPKICCSLSVSPLLHELIVRSSSLPVNYEKDGIALHLTALILEEIATAKIEKVYVPMPLDSRIQRIFYMMMDNPKERANMETWSKRAGVSERTLSRLLTQETGMSFGRWRQQLNVVLAVRWLAQGSSIQQVATNLGYESVPSFVTMFRKTLGTPPGRYMAERYTE